MGVELAAAFPVFATALQDVCTELDAHLDRPLWPLLTAEPDTDEAVLLDATEYTQPALFAIEVALFRLAESLGIRPDYLIGHSVGEVAAAHVAGVLNLADACTLIAARGRLMGALPTGGGMAAIQATEAEVSASLTDYADRLQIAAVNGPRALVVSGDLDALEEWLTGFTDRKTTRLRVSHAFHSHRMQPMLEDFRTVAAGLTFHVPTIPVVSNLTGGLVSTELTDPQYWVDHVRHAVRFADGISSLSSLGVTRYLELGPDAVLTAMARQCLDDDTDQLLVSALRARQGETESFATFLGRAHTAGVAIDWPAFYANTDAKTVPLPTYAFQHERYWLTPPPAVGNVTAAGLGRFDHPVLAALAPVGDRDEWLFTGRISQDTHTWTRDHAVFGIVVVPGTGLVELALTAGTELNCPVLEELVLEAPLLLEDETARQIQVTVSPAGEDGRREVAIYSRPDTDDHDEPRETTCHARGVLRAEADPVVQWPVTWPPEGAGPVSVESLYDRLAGIGLEYGPL
ncbi:MAG TPA: acyltransferase domain-containing protein, partial [Pseudonocardiaceae bacterium]